MKQFNAELRKSINDSKQVNIILQKMKDSGLRPDEETFDILSQIPKSKQKEEQEPGTKTKKLPKEILKNYLQKKLK